MNKIKIDNSELKELLSGKDIVFPKYATQIINLANSNAQGTRPRVVGQLSDLILEFSGKTLEEWEVWYKDKNPNAIENATEKVYSMVVKFQEVIKDIDETMIKDWVEQLIIEKTFFGLKFQNAIIKKIANVLEVEYQMSTPEDESRGIDGYIGGKAISIKPITYKLKTLNESIDVPIIYYEKKENSIIVEYNDLKLN